MEPWKDCGLGSSRRISLQMTRGFMSSSLRHRILRGLFGLEARNGIPRAIWSLCAPQNWLDVLYT